MSSIPGQIRMLSCLFFLLFHSLVSPEDDSQAIVAALPAKICVWLLAVALTFRTRRPSTPPG